jgi:hypothetical protein
MTPDEVLDLYDRAICDLRPLVAKATPDPLALHGRWTHFTRSLVDAGVARVVDVGSRVRCLHSGVCGTVVGETDGNTELVVEFDGGGTGTYKAGKRETGWELAAL